MVLLGNKKLAKKFNGKRVGQPNAFNANAMNANALLMNANNALLNANGNGNANAFVNSNAFNANANGNANALFLANANAGLFSGNFLNENITTEDESGEVIDTLIDSRDDLLSDNLTINQMEAATNVQQQVAVSEDGTRTFVLSDQESGAQVVAAIPAPQVVAQPVDDICEFPAQSVQLVRDVLITNTAPAIVDVQTDICGNVVSYTESMTRNMNATQWRAVNQAQLAGPVRAFTQNQNGTYINATGNIRLANSPGLQGFTAPQQVVTNQLVGKKRMHSSNVNAAYGANVLGKWKGA